MSSNNRRYTVNRKRKPENTQRSLNREIKQTLNEMLGDLDDLKETAKSLIEAIDELDRN